MHRTALAGIRQAENPRIAQTQIHGLSTALLRIRLVLSLFI